MPLALAALSWLLACALPTPAAAAEPDWTRYGALLERYVTQATIRGVTLNRVDYTGLRQDPMFAEVVFDLATFPLEDLVTREETLAFYINVYNILALKLVVDEQPSRSIRDIGNIFRPVWKRAAGTIGGAPISLDEIEHERLRKMDDPRIHFAIVCASVSCPDLRREPYTAAQLDAQLDAQSEAFLNNQEKGLRITDDRVEVSQIFKWFGEDFTAQGGTLAFIRRYHPLPPGAALAPVIDYDWSLNGG